MKTKQTHCQHTCTIRNGTADSLMKKPDGETDLQKEMNNSVK